MFGVQTPAQAGGVAEGRLNRALASSQTVEEKLRRLKAIAP
jgi:hypothetical protein